MMRLRNTDKYSMIEVFKFSCNNTKRAPKVFKNKPVFRFSILEISEFQFCRKKPAKSRKRRPPFCLTKRRYVNSQNPL
jgi:hypothetical protein